MKIFSKRTGSFKNYKLSVIVSLILLFIMVNFSSCKKYLDFKSDQTLTVPSTMEDCKLLLNNYNGLNMRSTGLAEILSDNFTVSSYTSWFNYSIAENKAAYIFEAQSPSHIANWLHYESAFTTNVVLEILTKITPSNPTDQVLYNNLKGSALFFRAYSFYQMAQLFAPAYDATTANSDLGLPLRLSPDISDGTTRASVQATYDRITSDLTEAATLLPTTAEHITQPNKAAAYAMLSRTFLVMRKYPLALENATKSLAEKSTLLDFNNINSFIKFNNPEVLCHVGGFADALTFSRGRVSPDFFNSYAANDKRRKLYFRPLAGGSYTISGSYTGEFHSMLGCPAVDEMYLTRAECNARAGNKDIALIDLNTLLKKRYDSSFVDRTAVTSSDALDIILAERRKELVYRNIRWTDIKRLNKEGRNIIITHGFPDNPATYSLQPNELRYALLIPKDIIEKAVIAQNPR